MNIHVSKEAANWYKNEIHFHTSPFIRFYVRYGGVGGLIPGFSLGINNDIPEEVHASTKVDNITFYISENDAWYFEDKDLIVEFDTKQHEPEFRYV